MDFRGQEDIRQLSGWLQEARKITVLSHTHPDGDALGSSAGLGLFLRLCLGKDVVCTLPDSPAENLRFILPEGLPFLCFDTDPDACRERIAASDLLILVDANLPHRTEGLEPFLRESTARKVLIDHHVGPDRETFPLVFSTTEISSASELIYWILKALKDTPWDISIGTALMTGMTTDTNNFANSVFPSTFQMASELIAMGVDRDALIRQIYQSYRENRIRVFGYMQSEGLTILDNGTAYMILTREVLRRFDIREGETEGLVNVPLAIDKVCLSVLLKEDEGHFRVSVRSKKGTSARELALRFFHGGGHENASGGKLFFPDDIPSPAEAPAYVEQALKAFLG